MSPIDTLIIGGGVAGAVAAAKVASMGKHVRLMQHAQGATLHSSGAVNVGHSDDPVHPYNRLSTHMHHMEDALKLLCELASDVHLVARDDGQDHVLVTQMGTLKRSRLVQKSLLFDLEAHQTIGVVQFSNLHGFDAEAVIRALRSSSLNVDVIPIYVNLESSKIYRSNVEMALHQNFESLPEAVKTALSKASIEPSHLLFPAVLGLNDPSGILKSVEKNCDVTASEFVAMPHSVPGMRLSQALKNGLQRRGVEIIHERVEHVENYERVILATGRVLGGGILSDAGVTCERIFNLPVWAGGRPVADRFLGNLDQFKMGLDYDEHLRPLNEFGELAYTHLYAAGSILGGYDPVTDGTGIGVAAFTGYLAAL